MNIFFRYFPLKNTSVATAMKGFFKENYHEESHFRPAKRMGGYLIPKIYRINQHMVLSHCWALKKRGTYFLVNRIYSNTKNTFSK